MQIEDIKKITIFAQDVTVRVVDEIPSEKRGDTTYYVDGYFSYENHEIVLARKRHGKPMSKRERTKVFYHELMHAALYYGMYLKLEDDEHLVDWLAKCLMVFKDQNIFKL